MDPDATIAIVRDTDATLTDRAEAAIDFLVWCARGGHYYGVGLRPHNDAINDCQHILNRVLDGTEPEI